MYQKVQSHVQSNIKYFVKQPLTSAVHSILILIFRIIKESSDYSVEWTFSNIHGTFGTRKAVLCSRVHDSECVKKPLWTWACSAIAADCPSGHSALMYVCIFWRNFTKHIFILLLGKNKKAMHKYITQLGTLRKMINNKKMFCTFLSEVGLVEWPIFQPVRTHNMCLKVEFWASPPLKEWESSGPLWSCLSISVKISYQCETYYSPQLCEQIQVYTSDPSFSLCNGMAIRYSLLKFTFCLHDINRKWTWVKSMYMCSINILSTVKYLRILLNH